MTRLAAASGGLGGRLGGVGHDSQLDSISFSRGVVDAALDLLVDALGRLDECLEGMLRKS